MAPDSVFAILFAIFLGIAYLLWLWEAVPRVRLLLIALGLACFVVSFVFREAEIAREVAAARSQ